MRYLHIHTAIWTVIVLMWTVLEMLLFGLDYLLYLVWNLQPCTGNLWRDYHYGFDMDGGLYADETPWQTIRRRYHMLQNIQDYLFD